MEISQCMIVKNEEKNIEKALSWGRNIVCEQIVVDTGSTDRTVELALSLGAKVYDFPWIDDFAAAKNYAISQAKGQWIAFLDADEMLAQGDEEKLFRVLEQYSMSDMVGLSTGWMQLNDMGEISAAGTQIRIFRNIPGLRYRRRIHEQLEWDDGRNMKIGDATQLLTILHSGYCDEAWKLKKVSQRNLNLILQELEDHPGDYEMLGYLGDEYYTAGESELAESYYKKAIANMPASLDSTDQRSAVTFLHLFEIISLRASVEEVDGLYEDAVQKLPQEPDFDYLLGRFYLSRELYDKGLIYLERAFAKLEQYGSSNRAMYLVANLKQVYEELALCCLMTDQFSKSVTYSVAVLKNDPYSASALYTLLKAFQGGKGVTLVPIGETVAFLNKIYNFSLKKDCLLVLRISYESGYGDLKEYMEKMFTEEELNYIKMNWDRSKHN